MEKRLCEKPDKLTPEASYSVKLLITPLITVNFKYNLFIYSLN